MYGSLGGYSSNKGSYPSNLLNSNFLTQKGTGISVGNEPDYVLSEREAVWANKGLLLPAVVGTAALYLFNFVTGNGKESQSKKKTKGMPGILLFTTIATAGLSLYVYNVLVATKGHPLIAYLPVSCAIAILILFYASVYYTIYRLVPDSFTGDVSGGSLREIITFVYFSITTFATAGMGDIAPVSIEAKILVSLQVLYFIYIFTMGLVFFANP